MPEQGQRSSSGHTGLDMSGLRAFLLGAPDLSVPKEILLMRESL